MSDAASSLNFARAFLFVPGDRAERHKRAVESGAGGVIVDLEDSVAIDQKVAVRQKVVTSFASLPDYAHAKLLVRVNACDTPWYEDDRSLVSRLSQQGVIAGVVLPKAESASDVAALASAVGPDCAILPLIETVAGLDAVDSIAHAPKVLRLLFGHLDFQVDAGLLCGPDEIELSSVRLELVLASRRATLAPPVDGITADWMDVTRLSSDSNRARRGGFGAKLCIHPSQVRHINEAFASDPKELAWAHRVCAASSTASGVVNVDGRMVDAPVVKLAQRIIEQSKQSSFDAPGKI